MSFASFPLDTLGLTPNQLTACTRGMPFRLSPLLRRADDPSLYPSVIRRQPIALSTPASLTTAADILLPSTADLTKRLRPLKLDKIHDLVSALSRAIVPASSVISELVGDGSDSDEDVLRTGDAGLDECLGGGLRIGSLTEFTGER